MKNKYMCDVYEKKRCRQFSAEARTDSFLLNMKSGLINLLNLTFSVTFLVRFKRREHATGFSGTQSDTLCNDSYYSFLTSFAITIITRARQLG